MARLLIGLWLLLAAAPLACAATVAGSVATYTLRLPCYQNCAAHGLGAGGEALATIGFDAAGYAPGGRLGRASLSSFEIIAGSYAASLGDFAGFHLSGTWGGSLAKVPKFHFQASSAVVDVLDFGHVPAGRTVQLGVAGAFRLLTAAPAGACQSVLCGNILVGGDYATYRPAPSAVPVPATAPLLAFGLFGLAVARRLRGRAAG